MKIGIVSSDAGGGELLSSYVNLNPGNYFFSIKGPSIDIFKRKVNRFKNYSLSEIISKVDLLICGTSAISNHELNAITMANHIETISIIDHWHYYKERFFRNGIYIFPKTFWVTDNYAFALFKKNFPKNKCILIENPYIKECKIEYNLLKSKQKKLLKNKILFISQKSEPTLLKSFLVNFQSYFKDFELIVRPHPAETIKSFSWLSNFKFPNLIIEKKKSLIENLYEAKYVIGHSSMALVVALELKKKVFYYNNYETNTKILPFKEIKDIKELIKIL